MTDPREAVATTADFAHCRRYWLAGRCPCCGIEVGKGDPVIAEGVRLCELCELRGHHLDEWLVSRILAALVPAPEA